jgi:hypothetical protein
VAVSRVASRQGLGTVRLGKAGGRAPSNNRVWRAAYPLNVGVTMHTRLNPDSCKGTCAKGAGSVWLVEQVPVASRLLASYITPCCRNAERSEAETRLTSICQPVVRQ